MKERRPLPSQARLRELFRYEPETGDFIRLVAGSARCHVGEVAGSLTHEYWRIRVDGGVYYAHRLAWKYFYGTDPAVFIDHINGNRRDNRIANLREADASENLANSRKQANTKNIFRGVWQYKDGKKFYAAVNFRGKKYNLGGFDTAEEARAACEAKRAEVHGEYASAA